MVQSWTWFTLVVVLPWMQHILLLRIKLSCNLNSSMVFLFSWSEIFSLSFSRVSSCILCTRSSTCSRGVLEASPSSISIFSVNGSGCPWKAIDVTVWVNPWLDGCRRCAATHMSNNLSTYMSSHPHILIISWPLHSRPCYDIVTYSFNILHWYIDNCHIQVWYWRKYIINLVMTLPIKLTPVKYLTWSIAIQQFKVQLNSSAGYGWTFWILSTH